MLKRKRGRKRRRNDDMGDLDINLIHEFSKRPAFYDRSDPNFKDKEFLQKCWDDVSMTLGYEVSMLKERIYQLRNRYNLEKRRLDNLRLENPDANIGSPWALFNHLQFLDGHIKPRRSYKTLMKRSDPNYIDNSSNLDRPSSTSSLMIVNNPHNINGMTIMAEHRYMQQLRERTETQKIASASSSIANNLNSVGNVEIKSENDSEDNDSEEDDTNMSNSNGNYVDPSAYLVNGNNSDHQDQLPMNPGVNNHPLPNITNMQSLQSMPLPSLQSPRALQCQQQKQQLQQGQSSNQQDQFQHHLQQRQQMEQQQHRLQRQQQMEQQQHQLNQQQQQQQQQQLPQQGEINVRSMSQLMQHQHSPKKQKRSMSSADKYEAFGKFLSASLCDLSEDKALMLVEKFTTEVVRALIDNHNKEMLNGFSLHKNL